MRLASYKGADGEIRSAVVVTRNGQDEVIDLNEASGGALSKHLKKVIAADNGLDQARQIAASGAQGKALSSVQLVAPLPNPGKIICIAGNFQAHIEEGGGQRVNKDVIVPKLFIKPSSAIIGSGETVTLSPVSENSTDWELELGIVLGRRGRDIPYERALDYVAGYTVFNDISGRTTEWNVEGRNPGGFDEFFDWLNGKWEDGFAAFGPWITTADEVPDPNNLPMELKVDGKVWQKGSTSDMIFNPAEIISFASQFMTWEPGDIIAGGTLDGTGDASGVYLAAGQTMYGTVGNLGTLVTPIAARTSPKGLEWRAKQPARA